VPYSLRQHGTPYVLYFVFALAERKNEIQEKIKYRSAEGKNTILRATTQLVSFEC
jgi:hypothetical protein